MAVENTSPRRGKQIFKGFSVFALLLTAGYIWLVLQSGANILNYIAILLGLLTAIASYISGSERLLERFNTRWEWVWANTIVFIIGFQLSAHGSMILEDIRAGRQFEIASVDGYGLVLFTVLFVFSIFNAAYGYYRPEIMFTG